MSKLLGPILSGSCSLQVDVDYKESLFARVLNIGKCSPHQRGCECTSPGVATLYRFARSLKFFYFRADRGSD
jgi:hypothetical protein